jgi:RNA polymerase sigma-70 factor (ECF subfamily)
VEELVLTRACAAGNNTAWERFLNRYRPTLYNAAYKVAPDEVSAREFADSLYAGLYGVSVTGSERSSKLMYYSGRGSLEGWLRTVIAQEYVNRYRRGRRETSLDEAVEQGKQFEAPAMPNEPAADRRLDLALGAEIAALDAEERFLLASYYLDGRTLAEIGRLMRVHESTISRKLERITVALRKRVRKRLIESGMSSRQADELMQDIDVRDVQIPLAKTLRQETPGSTFYKEGSEP